MHRIDDLPYPSVSGFGDAREHGLLFRKIAGIAERADEMIDVLKSFADAGEGRDIERASVDRGDRRVAAAIGENLVALLARRRLQRISNRLRGLNAVRHLGDPFVLSTARA